MDNKITVMIDAKEETAMLGEHLEFYLWGEEFEKLPRVYFYPIYEDLVEIQVGGEESDFLILKGKRQVQAMIALLQKIEGEMDEKI